MDDFEAFKLRASGNFSSAEKLNCPIEVTVSESEDYPRSRRNSAFGANENLLTVPNQSIYKRQRSRSADMGRDRSTLGDIRENDEDSEKYVRVRSFSCTEGGLLNHGDILRLREVNRDALEAEAKEHNIVIVGASGVGKTSLAQQFATSDFLCAQADG